MEEAILSCKNLSLKLGGISIFENISLTLHRGELHLLMGENGTGKTSLVNILSGIYPFPLYTGDIHYKGHPLRLHMPKDAIKQHIVTIHQDIALFERMTIAENLYANLPETIPVKSTMSLSKKIKMADLFFHEHGLMIDSSRLICHCSSTTQRTIELLKLYLMKPDLLILDEPIAVINSRHLDIFLQLIAYLKKGGTTILCIAHDYQAFLPLIDHFSIFQGKCLAHTINRSDYSLENVENILKNDFCQSKYPKINIKKGAEVLCAENLCMKDTLKDISFTLQKGEILGFYGRAGSGKNALPKALFGIEPISHGSLYIDRLPARIASPQDAINLGLAYITDERYSYGLFHNLDSLENVFSIKKNRHGRFWTRTGFEFKQYLSYAEKMNLRVPPKINPQYLSGGQQQKLILMRWLMSPAKIFIFNEPTQSLDIPSKIDIYNLFNDLIMKGCSILIFSSNLEELMGVCDRIIYISHGVITGETCYGENVKYVKNLI
ncbi:MAG: ATP-binding cassette domain-containing protein [Lachnospiraceae bacterium]|nr:ATP-binding cassette domain-containing protein [Lachnospiraceae bacterium]